MEPDVISRPYPRGKKYFRELLGWCERYDLDFSCGGVASWHLATIVLQIYRQDLVNEFDGQDKTYADAFEASTVTGPVGWAGHL